MSDEKGIKCNVHVRFYDNIAPYYIYHSNIMFI